MQFGPNKSVTYRFIIKLDIKNRSLKEYAERFLLYRGVLNLKTGESVFNIYIKRIKIENSEQMIKKYI